MTNRIVVCVVLLLATAAAQMRTDSTDVARHVRVRIAFGDHAPCDSSTRVALIGGMGFALAEGTLSGECTAEFYDVPSGRYRVTVSGPNTANADDGDVEVSSAISQDVEVRARHSKDGQIVSWANAGFVSVRDLAVPRDAAKEFEKANRFIAKQDWEKASERLLKGLAIYPKYATGYNNLGAVYFHQKKNSQAREALQKAIELDDRMAPAYVNLARVNFLEKDFPAAESLLSKALSLAPATSTDELVLLSFAQVVDEHLDGAIATSRQGHGMQLKEHGFLHLAASNAFERQGKIGDALAELQMYVKEEPNGPQMEKVKDAISKLQQQIAKRDSDSAIVAQP
jgi:tetratricopeptide (TPR) repeat protein